MSAMKECFQKAVDIFKRNGGMLRMSEAIQQGISRYTLYAMRDAGIIDALSRGVYRIGSIEGMTNPDLVTVARRVPEGVIYLISALSFHDITTQVPHAVDIAIPRKSRAPKIDYPPTNTYRVFGDAFSHGIEHHNIDGTIVKIYSVEKSVADVFKHRNKLGMEVAAEALRLWSLRADRNLNELVRYSKVCRIEKIIRPYLEALK